MLCVESGVLGVVCFVCVACVFKSLLRVVCRLWFVVVVFSLCNVCVVRCVLCAVCCGLRVMGYKLRVGCWALCVVRCALCVARRASCVVGSWLLVVVVEYCL